MQPDILQQVRTSLAEKRIALGQWLAGASAADREVSLGPEAESAVKQHLDHLDGYLAQAQGGKLGLCTVCHDFVDSKRLVVDYTADVCLDHLSQEEAAGLERELEMAQVVQRALLPSDAPEVPGLQLAAFTRPAQIIGGDYFDFLAFESGEQGWAIGDVAGHGVSASLHMAGLQALCRAVLPTSAGPAEAAQRIQRLFVHNSRYTTFVSLFLAAFSPETRRLTYCNAGHNPPLLVRSTPGSAPTLEWLQPTGAAVGLVEDADFRQLSVELRPGDLLVMYTDGVVEAADPAGRLFETTGLSQTVVRASGGGAGEVVRAITQAVEDHLGGKDPADDITLVVARVG